MSVSTEALCLEYFVHPQLENGKGVQRNFVSAKFVERLLPPMHCVRDTSA